MLSCGADIRQFGLESNCVEEAAEKIVNYLYRSFESESGEKALALVRLFKTVRFDELDEDLKKYAAANFDVKPDTKFMALMATAGIDQTWNDRRQSAQHRLIPVTAAEDAGRQSTLIRHMMSELEHSGAPNVESTDLNSRRYVMEPNQRHFNVFHIPDASECAFVQDEELVRNFDVRSILGFGGFLNRGSRFCVVMFARTFLDRDCAELFNPLTLSTKNALIYATDFRMHKARRQLA